MTEQQDHNLLRFPHMITLIDLEPDGSQPQVRTITSYSDPKMEKLKKKYPHHIIQIWKPQHEETSVRYFVIDVDTDYYYKKLKSDFDWEGVVSDAKDNTREEDGEMIGSCYLGSVLSLAPSGKYYTPWAHGNVDTLDAVKDEQYYAALERLCEEHGGYLASGEGDPLDQYFEMTLEEPAEEEEEDDNA